MCPCPWSVEWVSTDTWTAGQKDKVYHLNVSTGVRGERKLLIVTQLLGLPHGAVIGIRLPAQGMQVRSLVGRSHVQQSNGARTTATVRAPGAAAPQQEEPGHMRRLHSAGRGSLQLAPTREDPSADEDPEVPTSPKNPPNSKNKPA